MFGDSQTAGLGVGNAQRFSDLLEKALPGLHIHNHGLDGVGTDQLYLAWKEFGQVQHDLLVLCVYVEDIARVNSRFLKFQDAEGKEVFYAKPYFDIGSDGLALNHIPVPKRPVSREELPADPAPAPAQGNGAYRMARAALRVMLPHPALRKAAKDLGLIDLAQKVTAIQRAPGYESADNPGWRLLADIITRWIAESPVPVLIVPIPNWTFVEQSADPEGYRARYRELAAATGAALHDPLPDLWSYTPEERRAFRFKSDPHLTVKGHQAMARSLTPVFETLMREKA